MDSAHVTDVAERYARFAEHEIRHRNPVFQAWATGVADDPDTCALIETLPPLRRQPVLVFAAARFCGVPDTTDYSEFRAYVHSHWDDIAEVARTHSTQTNEARRIGCLLPFVAAAGPTVSLIEVGASAGLNLYPDRYSFRFFAEGLAEPTSLEARPGPLLDDDSARIPPVLDVSLRGMIPSPRAVPHVAYRGGVDLNPLDPADPDDRAWLRTLVWPGHDERLERLDRCLDIAATEPADLLTGDLVDRIAESVARAKSAAPDAVPVVFHTAVLAYLEPHRREAFVDVIKKLIRDEGAVWISNEGMPILPDVAAQLPPQLQARKGLFVVAVNGTALATSHGHGEWVRTLD